MGTNDKAMLGTSGYERVEHDLYETPAWCTEVLLRHVVFQRKILEPAAGRGAIAKVLSKNNYEPICQDLMVRDYVPCEEFNFFKREYVPKSFDIITNPPYDKAEEFVRHALAITGGTQKVAMLLRNEWDCAHTRTDLFTDEVFRMKIVLTRRPRWIADTDGSPRHNYAWYVWCHGWYAPPELRYAR